MAGFLGFDVRITVAISCGLKADCSHRTVGFLLLNSWRVSFIKSRDLYAKCG